MDIPDTESTHALLGEPFPISGRYAGDVIRVPFGVEAELAPTRWCVYEWTDYIARYPGADRLRVGSTWLPSIAQTDCVFQVRFENQLGLTSFTPYSGSQRLAPALHIEVLARKFTHPQQSVEFTLAILDDFFARQPSLPFETVAKRALDMLERMEQDGFVSFG